MQSSLSLVGIQLGLASGRQLLLLQCCRGGSCAQHHEAVEHHAGVTQSGTAVEDIECSVSLLGANSSVDQMCVWPSSGDKVFTVAEKVTAVPWC